MYAKYSNRQDSLRGTNNVYRSWWDVQKYELTYNLDTPSLGKNNVCITAKVIKPGYQLLQVDIQPPLKITSVAYHHNQQKVNGGDIVLPYKREGNVYWIKFDNPEFSVGDIFMLLINFEGAPRKAVNPPWDGGLIDIRDSLGLPWKAIACQGLGASSWWPCKDYQGDEPDSGMTLHFISNTSQPVISNGQKLDEKQTVVPRTGELPPLYYTTTTWTVTNPINSYNATFYYGNYTSWEDTLHGEKGILNLTYYPLKNNEEKARDHFKVVKQMLHCFEYWMGPYPFYQDGYKIVEAPYLGMEHQSAVAYGNTYKMGYLGKDRSNTGIGLAFDYLIVHESGHEWFGNNITASDIADNWLHEGFTTYSETLFAEWILGKEKAFQYCRGEWQNIRNDRPVLGTKGIHDEGSSDKYDKGAAVVHMMRMIINNDSLFRELLRSLNSKYYHRTVSTEEVEKYICDYTHYDFQAFFDQYLRTTDIPTLKYKLSKNRLYYKFTKVTSKFHLPLVVSDNLGHNIPLDVTAEWKSVPWKYGYNLSFSKDFLIEKD